MAEERFEAPAWLIRWEMPLTVLLAALGFASIPIALGHIGLSWDALNHHIYLGWTAEQPRFDRDYLAALYQGYLFPYTYWPAYKLAMAGASGVVAGVVLALLQATVVPAVWKISHACMPGTTWFDLTMRAIGVATAFMSCVVLSMFDTTSNDLLVAIPLVWSIAIALEPLSRPAAGEPALRRVAVVSGLLAGVAVAFKLTNGPIAIVLPLLWLWPRGAPAARIWRGAIGCVSVVLGYTVVYGYWGWQLWSHFGNPIYPFYDDWFAPLRVFFGFRL